MLLPRTASSASLVGLVACLGCGGGSVRSDPGPGTGPVAVTPRGELRIAGKDGAVRLVSVASRSVQGGVPYASFGFGTAAEPELVPPSFDTQAAVPDPDPSSRHVATGVVSTTKTADGETVVLSTDDPQGRTLSLTVHEAADAPVEVTLDVSDPRGVTSVFATFASDTGEAFHGFGGRRESTNLRGQAFSTWVFDYRFPTPGTAYYYPQPLFLSSRGYALWVDTDALARFRMASDVGDAFRISVAAPSMRLVVAPEGGAAGAARITALTGRQRQPPSWSLGPTLSRTLRIGTDTPAVYQTKVEDDVARLVGGEVSVDAYAYEGWARLPTEFVKATNAKLSAASIHPMLYLRPFVSNDAAGTEPLGRFDEAVQKGLVAKTAGGDPYLFPSPFDRKDAALVDFTNPDARTWWKGLVRQVLDLGADGFMNDFGEQVLPDMVFADGSTGVLAHNRYPVLQHRTTREAVDEFVAEHPDREIFFFVRGGYTGRPGSMAYENAQFPGDETCNFAKDTGLPSIVPDMLNRSIGGGYGFTTDIGGYADFDGKAPDAELYVRWTEAAALTTHFRVHNAALTGVRMPWGFDATTEETWKSFAALHRRAIPLVEKLWADALAGGAPPVRPIWLDAEDAGGSTHADDEWMLGPDVVVAPVLEKGATSREVFLPRGCWKLHGEGDAVTGPTTLTVAAPLTVLPWYARCDTTPF